MEQIITVKSIAEAHRLLNLPEPKHPLISLIHDQDVKQNHEFDEAKFTTEMYFINYKGGDVSGSLNYGRNSYDFQSGTMVFWAPHQVVSGPPKDYLEHSKGWSLMFHPDLIRKSALGKRIGSYTFFSYESNEALHLSARERSDITELVQKIKQEYEQNLDQHSHGLIITYLELLLQYCTRFYDRQFFTRTSNNKDHATDFVVLLNNYFETDQPSEVGIPSVKYFSDQLNMSANYLSDLVKKETGKSVKSHINNMIVEKAKNTLLNSNKKISQIAYSLGFEYPQSFTKHFKKNVGMSPKAYRNLSQQHRQN